MDLEHDQELAKAVKEIMTRNVITVGAEDTVLAAAKAMNRHDIGCVIVTNDGKPVGIITERDIMRRVVSKRLDPLETKSSDVMSQPLLTVTPSTRIEQATKKMVRKKIKKLAVTRKGQLVGVLSLTDLVRLTQVQGTLNNDAFFKAPKRVQRVFQIYYDPVKQKRKNCPLTMARGMAISCLGTKCMWFVGDRCAFLIMAEKASN